jgi:hypothetical protein
VSSISSSTHLHHPIAADALIIKAI